MVKDFDLLFFVVFGVLFFVLFFGGMVVFLVGMVVDCFGGCYVMMLGVVVVGVVLMGLFWVMDCYWFFVMIFVVEVVGMFVFY